jgi:hypothetical protein
MLEPQSPEGESPTVIETKYPSGRQDATAMPKTLQIGTSVQPEKRTDIEMRHPDLPGKTITAKTEDQAQVYMQSGWVERGAFHRNRERLLEFIEQGEAVLARINAAADHREPTSVEHAVPLWLRQVHGWADEVETWLQTLDDRAYFVRFRDPPTASVEAPNPISQAAEFAEYRKVWGGVRRRLDTLHAFLQERPFSDEP